MEVALEEAARGVGLTRPNPPVGAVLVRNGKIIGRGFHPKAGKPHAEILALREAGAAAQGATLYVTLEPCCTQGRTPPCTEAIIRSGIRRVVYGCVDPNPAHAGRADRLLTKAGIQVAAGVLEEPCRELILPFATRIREGRPYVTLKLACSLDGRIADAAGTSKWITGDAARQAVQELRRTADAILVGAETLREDDPSLLPRPARGRKPWRVIVAGRRPLPKQARVFTDGHEERTLVVADRHLRIPGVRCLRVAGSRGRVAMPAVLRALSELDCLHVVCEGGGVLAQSLLKAGLVDELWMFYAPLMLGGDARASVAGRGWKLGEAPAFTITGVLQTGNDVLIKARRR